MKQSVVHYIESNGFGGAEQMMLSLFQEIDTNKWETILVYHPNSGINPFIDKARELQIKTLAVPTIKGLKDIGSMKSLIVKLRELRPDVFHAHLVSNLRCSFGIISAYLAGVKAIVTTQHSFQISRSAKLHTKYKRTIYQKLISLFVDQYIAVSYQQAEHLKGSIMYRSKVKVIPNGINVKNFSLPADKTLLNSIQNNLIGKPVILTVARLDKLKGHKYLIDAAEMVPEATFLLAGDGPERANFEHQALELNIANRVLFLGRRNDIPELLKACDLFVLPSLLEGMPVSILEAMAASKPVISTDIEGVNEIIIDGHNGLIIPAADRFVLAEKIKLLLSDKQLANKLSINGLELVSQKFTAQQMAMRITKLYEELLYHKKQAALG